MQVLEGEKEKKNVICGSNLHSGDFVSKLRLFMKSHTTFSAEIEIFSKRQITIEFPCGMVAV